METGPAVAQAHVVEGVLPIGLVRSGWVVLAVIGLGVLAMTVLRLLSLHHSGLLVDIVSLGSGCAFLVSPGYLVAALFLTLRARFLGARVSGSELLETALFGFASAALVVCVVTLD
jgi:hypothetical protein